MSRARGGRRRWSLWTSVVILALTAAIHIGVGTPQMLPSLHGVDAVLAGTWTVLWHVVSVLLVGLPVALAWAARTEAVRSWPVVVVVWVQCVVWMAVFFAVDVAQFGAAVLTMPQWVLFVPVVLLLPLARPAARAVA